MAKKIGGRRVTRGQKVGQSNLQGVLSGALDFVPGIGDAKAFYEAETPLEYGLAGVGLIPGVGDAAAAGIKGLSQAWSPLYGVLKGTRTSEGAVDASRHNLHRRDVPEDIKRARAADAENIYREYKKGNPIGSTGDTVYEDIPDSTGIPRDIIQYEAKPGEGPGGYHYFMADKKGDLITQFEGKGPLHKLDRRRGTSTPLSYARQDGSQLADDVLAAPRTPLGKRVESTKSITAADVQALRDQGHSTDKIAEILGVSKSAVKKAK